MQIITLTNVPSQAISARLDDIYSTLRIYEGNGTMLVDIVRDGVSIVTGLRILAGEPLIPFRHLENGNFVLLTRDGTFPDWRNFGKTQTLVYLNVSEVESYLNGTA